MNLNSIVSGAINAVNPQVAVMIQQSTGSTTGADGSQIPTYNTIPAFGQMQSLSASDLKRLEAIGIQGLEAMGIQSVQQKIYLNGDYEGIFRVLGKGGDMLTIGNYTYLVTAVLERWPDWVSLGITMQVS